MVERVEGLQFLFDQGIAKYLRGKKIDYHTGFQEGFSITAETPAADCGGCC